MIQISNSKSTQKKRDGQIQSLNGIRGLAFLLVLIAHLSNYYGDFLQGIGKVGVWLFFVLSAYLLTYYFLSNRDRITTKYEWLNYGVRRFFRIIPLYFVVLIIYFLNDYLINNTESLRKHVFLLEGAGHFWTIPAEFKFYIVLPIVIFTIYFLRFSISWTLITLTTFTVIHQFIFPASVSEISTISTLTYLPVFLFGSLAALIQIKIKDNYFSNKTKRYFDVLSIILIAIFLITVPGIWSLLFNPVESTYFYRDFIFLGVILALFLISIQNGTGLISNLFESKALIFFGKISYSGYLIHPLILNKVKNHFPDLMAFDLIILSIVLILFFAILLHIFIEKPCMRISFRKPS